MVNYINQGTIGESTKRIKSTRLQKALKLNLTWHPRKKNLEEATVHLAEVSPKGAPPQPDRHGGGAGRPPPGATSALLPEGSSTTDEDQSKPLVRSV
jgi:hypothetical protein